MIVTTTPAVEGRPVKDYLGIVSGEAVLSGTLSDLGAALQNLGNPRHQISERILFQAHQVALEKMTGRAAELGANALVGVAFNYEHTTSGAMMVIATGTAVLIP
jgi:uncharacterized protein YbjQ (UPF0145 family)